MTEYAATHSGKNKVRKSQYETKETFKCVLDNPFSVKWPPVPLNVQNLILSRVVEIVKPLKDLPKQNRRKKQLKAKEIARKSKQKVVSSSDEEQPMSVDKPPPTKVLKANDTTAPPAISEHIVIGINAVTKRLEAQMRDTQRISLSTTELPPPPSTLSPRSESPLRVVIVCRSDVDPELLVAHFPQLVAACNSRSRDSARFVKLVPVPKLSESVLIEALGLRRVAVIALDAAICDDDPSFAGLLDSVPTVAARWLVAQPDLISPKSKVVDLVPTHIKQLRTTAPKDMRAAKERRAEGRAAAKKRKKELKSRCNKTASRSK